MDNTEQFNCISLCTGYAGIEMGIRRNIPSLRTVAYVEIEAFACANLVAKIEQGKLDAAPIWTDIKTFDGKPFRDRVHIVTGGYPCQGESVAGKRLREKDPRWLWPYIERIVESVRPLYCFFENVPGHLTGGYPTVYRSLRLMGYSVEAGLFTAAEIGAPHKRERLFILANDATRGCEDVQIQQAGQSAFRHGCRSMENPERLRRRRGDKGEPAGQGRPLQAQRPSELADTSSTELSRRESQPGNNGEKFQTITGSCDKWPSRPGQPQFDWEEPRVVADTDSNRKEKRHRSDPFFKQLGKVPTRENCEDTTDESANTDEENRGQTKPQLGRAANGTKSRVDRLRLLGNGVVPQCAELAFRTLAEQVIYEKD